ncbi:MAG: phosphatidate cytidylyltransferase, partial [Hypericibacter sp.]
MSPTTKWLWLVAGILLVLVTASLVGYLLARRQQGKPSGTIANLNSRIKAWWVMVVLIAIAFALGKVGVLVLFAFCSFTALREFITLTPTRRGDHIALATAFFIVLPAQYVLIGENLYGIYSIFIPVYVFLGMPIIAALRGDTTLFISRIAEVRVQMQNVPGHREPEVAARLRSADDLLAQADLTLDKGNYGGASYLADRAGDLVQQARAVAAVATRQSNTDSVGIIRIVPPRTLEVTVAANLRKGPDSTLQR